MPFVAYENSDSRRPTLDVIEQANIIIAEYQRRGFKLTLRQLYYQFVSRGLMRNSSYSYDRLGKIIVNGRMRGLIDWAAIEDRTRKVQAGTQWASAAEMMQATATNFRLERWAMQPHHVEVWITKEALSGVLAPVCDKWGLPLFACKGYPSQSSLWEAGQRFAGVIETGRTPIVLHLSDHSPTGIDATRDIRERLSTFTGEPVSVERLALNPDQIEQYTVPSSPTKSTDSRARDYVATHGNKSWELDALSPEVLAGLIETRVSEIVDHAAWEAVLQLEGQARAAIYQSSQHL